jgi:ubiquinone/menaquinone biosynthesis C-methylase UbiE
VIGIDLSPERVAEARAAAEAAGIANVVFEEGDVRSLRFPADTFDVAFEHCVFMHLKDPAGAAREIYRVLKPNGLVAARDHDHDFDADSTART